MLFTKTYQLEVVDIETRKDYKFIVESRNINKINQSLAKKYKIIDIKKLDPQWKQSLEKMFSPVLKKSEILKVLRFLAQALKRGVPLKKALEFLIISEEKLSIKLFLKKMYERIEKQFMSYLDIFSSFPEYFDHIFLGVVKAGESVGTLPENILQYVNDQEKQEKQKEEIFSVLIKRMMLLFVVFLVSLIIILFVIPQFFKLFKNIDKIPQVLIFLMDLAEFLSNYGVIIIIVILSIIFLFYFFLKRSYKIRKTKDWFLIKIPFFGNILRTYYTCQYLYFTGTLLQKNVNYLRIMDILIDQTKNIPFKEAFVIMKENVIKGVSLPEMLRRSEKNLETTYKKIPAGLFLLSLSQALEMGSLTGDMGKILYDSFLTYDEILSQKIDVGIKLFDRILYMGIVLIMGVLFYAMGTAMATLYQNAGSMVG